MGPVHPIDNAYGWDLPDPPRVDITATAGGIMVIRRDCVQTSVAFASDDRVDVQWMQYGPTEIYAAGGGNARDRRRWRRELERVTRLDPSLTFCGAARARWP